MLESAAYGVASELSESEVMVAVVLQPGALLEPDGAARLLPRASMAHFAIPRYVRFMDALPKNHAERVQKFELREERRHAPDTWDREAHGVQGAAVTRTGRRSRIQTRRDVTVEIRDGVRLATDVYLPEGRGAVPDAPDADPRQPVGGRSSSACCS